MQIDIVYVKLCVVFALLGIEERIEKLFLLCLMVLTTTRDRILTHAADLTGIKTLVLIVEGGGDFGGRCMQVSIVTGINLIIV